MCIILESSEVRRPKQSSEERSRAVATCDEHICEGNLNASLCIGSFLKYRILKYSTRYYKNLGFTTTKETKACFWDTFHVCITHFYIKFRDMYR